jgi:hypothetical protein
MSLSTLSSCYCVFPTHEYRIEHSKEEWWWVGGSVCINNVARYSGTIDGEAEEEKLDFPVQKCGASWHLHTDVHVLSR